MDEKRRNHCDSHFCTMSDINALKEENQKIRQELIEVKEAVESLKEFESMLIARYKRRKRTLWQKIKDFFRGNNN